MNTQTIYKYSLGFIKLKNFSFYSPVCFTLTIIHHLLGVTDINSCITYSILLNMTLMEVTVGRCEAGGRLGPAFRCRVKDKTMRCGGHWAHTDPPL